MKKLIIEICNHCSYFSSDMYGERCFHPQVTKPHTDGATPKQIESESSFGIEIPKWCPLEDAE